MTLSLDGADIADLRSRVRGVVSRPTEPAYATAGFNLAVSRRPWAVIDPVDAADIAETLRYAADNSFTVAVHNSGHGASDIDGNSLLVRTSGFDRCEIDVTTRTARVGAGVRWQTVIDAAAPHGLAPLAGSAPAVGVMGYLTGAGIGPFVRTVGLSSDYIRSFEVVTGDGTIHQVTPETNAELFWGLRGGKGTLGIVTEVVIDLLPITEFYGGAIYFDGAAAADVYAAWLRLAADLPRSATTSIALLQLPAQPGVPPVLAGRTTVSVRLASLDDPGAAAALLDEVRAAGSVLLDAIGTLPYAAMGAVHADPVDPMPTFERSALLSEVSPELIAELLRQAGPDSGSPQVVVELRLLGGALADPPSVPSAFDHRGAAANVMVIGALVPPIADVVPAHAEGLIAALSPWATGGELPNFGTSTDPARLRRCYDQDTYAWLAALGAQHDPAGVLRVGAVAR